MNIPKIFRLDKNKKKKKQTQQRRYRSDRYNDEYDDIENW